MEIQSQTPGSRQAPPVDDLFEDFDFKPLSDGLGFHHGNKQQEVVKEASRVVAERSTAAKPAPRPSHPFEQHRLAQPVAEVQREFVQNDLALFYQSQKAPEIILNDEVKVETLASTPLRLSAFAIDMALIVGMAAFTIQLVSLLTDLELWYELFTGDMMMLGTAVTLFSGYFVLYFTMLEKFQGKSIGKDLLGIRLSSLRNFTMGQVLSRTVITLVGFLSLGLTNLVDLPGKITGTKVVR